MMNIFGTWVGDRKNNPKYKGKYEEIQIMEVVKDGHATIEIHGTSTRPKYKNEGVVTKMSVSDGTLEIEWNDTSDSSGRNKQERKTVVKIDDDDHIHQVTEYLCNSIYDGGWEEITKKENRTSYGNWKRKVDIKK